MLTARFLRQKSEHYPRKTRKGKGMFLYSAVSSPLHFIPWQTCSFQYQLDFSGQHSSHAAITREDHSFTFPPTSIARYSFIQLSELGRRGENKNLPTLKRLQRGFEPGLSRLRARHSTALRTTIAPKSCKKFIYIFTAIFEVFVDWPTATSACADCNHWLAASALDTGFAGVTVAEVVDCNTFRNITKASPRQYKTRQSEMTDPHSLCRTCVVITLPVTRQSQMTDPHSLCRTCVVITLPVTRQSQMTDPHSLCRTCVVITLPVTRHSQMTDPHSLCRTCVVISHDFIIAHVCPISQWWRILKLGLLLRLVRPVDNNGNYTWICGMNFIW